MTLRVAVGLVERTRRAPDGTLLQAEVWPDGGGGCWGVKLRPAAEDWASRLGVECAESVLAHGRKARTGLPQDRDALVEAHVLGKRGELAVALAYDLPLPHTQQFTSEPDVWPYNVRTTRRVPASLIIRPCDSLAYPWLLVTGWGGLRIVGLWPPDTTPADAYLMDPGGYGPAWFVPRSALQPPPPVCVVEVADELA